MKKLLFLPILFLLVGLTSQDATAQKKKTKAKPLVYECYYRQTCIPDPSDPNVDLCDGEDEISTFYIAKDREMFTHVTPSITSEYYVQEYELDESGIELFYVISDAGNHYFMGFDAESKKVLVMTANEDDDFYIEFLVTKVKKGKYKAPKE